MGTLRRLNAAGDAETRWDKNNLESTAAAEQEFRRLVARGGVAFLTDGPNSGEQIHKFDETAEEIIIVPQIRGGCC